MVNSSLLLSDFKVGRLSNFLITIVFSHQILCLLMTSLWRRNGRCTASKVQCIFRLKKPPSSTPWVENNDVVVNMSMIEMIKQKFRKRVASHVPTHQDENYEPTA
ncbi:hypothetical protein YC2023_050648 [Brassica napus]